ncbi:AzlD domain-containing protein [Tumebacillus sp. ITR2]|uniref:AzlD domain-containing protein n=1 Tax=Tumebacillus amylolyticus TaxID=2801339 RepID=A0ABS1J8N3_9BACL|nr:AzlD domain-containing protein [Tumebacillus amylolyticus]
MDEQTIWLTILGMSLVTVIPRLLPVWLLAGRTLPPLVVTWLRYVPVAVLAAMLAPSLVLQEGHLDFSWSNLYFWVSLPTIAVAWKTRNLFLTVITGMGGIALVRLLLT